MSSYSPPVTEESPGFDSTQDKALDLELINVQLSPALRAEFSNTPTPRDDDDSSCGSNLSTPTQATFSPCLHPVPSNGAMAKETRFEAYRTPERGHCTTSALQCLTTVTPEPSTTTTPRDLPQPLTSLQWMADEVRFEEREMDSCEQVRISGYSIFVRIRYFPQRLTAEEILRVISHGNCAPTEMIYKLDGCCGQELEGNLYRYYCTRGDERMSVIWHDEWLTLFEVSRLGPWSIILMSYGIAAFKLIWLLVKILLGM